MKLTPMLNLPPHLMTSLLTQTLNFSVVHALPHFGAGAAAVAHLVDLHCSSKPAIPDSQMQHFLIWKHLSHHWCPHLPDPHWMLSHQLLHCSLIDVAQSLLMVLAVALVEEWLGELGWIQLETAMTTSRWKAEAGKTKFGMFACFVETVEIVPASSEILVGDALDLCEVHVLGSWASWELRVHLA